MMVGGSGGHWRLMALVMAASAVVAVILGGPANAQADNFEANPSPALAYQTGLQAREAFRTGDYAAASPLYRSVCQDNPYRAANWEALGHSLLRIGGHTEADSAFLKCVDLGYRVSEMHYNRACNYALAGQVEHALDALEHAYATGFINDHLVAQDTDLDTLRKTGRFLRITGRPDPALTDREKQWKADLEYFDRRMRELHVDLFGTLSTADYEADLHRIQDRVPEYNDTQLKYALQTLLARVGDGHTSVVMDRFLLRHGHGNVQVQAFPFDPWRYRDGVRLRRVDSTKPALRGARILRIGNVPIDDAMQRIDTLVSRDNEWGAQWISMEYLTTPGALRALGLIGDSQSLELTVQLTNGETKVVEFTAIDAAVAMRSLAAEPAHGGAGASRPLYLRDPGQPFWLERVEEQGILWWQFNAVHDSPHQSLAQLAEHLDQELSHPGTRALVIDLRRNHGGQGHLLQPLLHTLIRWSAKREAGRIFVLIGRETFSAAMAFATQLEIHLPVTFIGEPTGSRPNFIGESSVFVLPYSGIPISCSTRFHQNGNPTDKRVAIGPHIYAPISFKDEVAGRDPAYQAVVEVLKGS